MNMLGICAVFCLMIIRAVDVCGAECDEYVVVFEEITCPSHVKLTPLKSHDINWDKVQGYPCNSTDENSGKKKCVVEFDCLGTMGSCQNHIKIVNHQTHSFIDNHTAKPITSTTEALDVLKSNIAVDKKPHHTIDEEFNTSTYNVNLIYIKDIQNSSKTTTKNSTLYCDYAETVCINGGRPENYSLSDVKNIHTLEIAINRDETSRVQPLFTGYFPESSNDISTSYINHFKYLKTVTLTCPTLKYNNCKQNVANKSSKQINLYIKANFIENNTITQYPECTKNSITSENALNLKCEDISFAKNNPQIVQTPPTPPPKQVLSTWHCQITELKYTSSSKEQGSENSKTHFINCSNETNISNNKNKYEDINVTAISDNKNISIYNILTREGIKMNTTEISAGKEETNLPNSSQENPENIITILISEKANSCSHNSYFNINEGKIIALSINNTKEKILQNNNVELILSNCINVTSSTISETRPHPKVELSIILKNESLNNAHLKQFNGTLKDESVKQRILLRCDHPNLDLSSNITSNKTVLQCESLDLDLYNITGLEMSISVNPTLNANNTKEKKKENLKMGEENYNQTKVNKNNNFSTNKTVEKNESTVSNKSNENNIKVVDNKQVQKNILEGNENKTKAVRNKEVQKNISESKDNSKTLIFNRKKDILNGAGQNNLAVGSPETEKILLMALLTIASVAILMVIALKACPKKREYNPAPTREPPDEEETAF